MMYEEVISANDNLRSIYSQDAQSFKKLLEQILNYGVFKSRQYKYFLCRVFLGEPLVHLLLPSVRGSFLYDHYVQVVINRKKGITVVVKKLVNGPRRLLV